MGKRSHRAFDNNQPSVKEGMETDWSGLSVYGRRATYVTDWQSGTLDIILFISFLWAVALWLSTVKCVSLVRES